MIMPMLHSPKFEDLELRALFAQPDLSKQNRPRRGGLNQRGDKEKGGPRNDQEQDCPK